VRNLGAFAAPDGHLVFDLNDFDETIPGPWEWDVKRLATSLVVAGRAANDSDAECEDAARRVVAAYREGLEKYASMPVVELARHEIRHYPKDSPVSAVLAKAERVTPLHVLRKLTVITTDGIRFDDSKVRRLPEDEAGPVREALAPYRDTLSPDRQHV